MVDSFEKYLNILDILNNCIYCKCNKEVELVKKYKYEKINDLIYNEDFNIKLINSELYKSDVFKNMIKCKLTYCYDITHLYLDYTIKKYNINYNKITDKYTEEDYINIFSQT
jgi:hypothetical protein